MSSLYNIQPKLNQSALESYGVPLDKTSGAMYPCVPLRKKRKKKKKKKKKKSFIQLQSYVNELETQDEVRLG